MRHENRDALRLIEADDKRGGGMAIVNGQTFRDGTIEIAVAGRRGPYAVADDRGFVGVAFRISALIAASTSVCYLRPDNGRAEDQVRRPFDAGPIASRLPWPRMRQEFPEKDQVVRRLQPGVWTRMRIEVAGATARLFVHGNAQPNLIVNDLKHGVSEGGVALWIGAGSEAFFWTPYRASLSSDQAAKISVSLSWAQAHRVTARPRSPRLSNSLIFAAWPQLSENANRGGGRRWGSSWWRGGSGSRTTR